MTISSLVKVEAEVGVEVGVEVKVEVEFEVGVRGAKNISLCGSLDSLVNILPEIA